VRGLAVPPASAALLTRHTDIDDLHSKFVGDVDLPESEEPLLVESTRRFVLFPIRFHEVSAGAAGPPQLQR
jgi:ribonucleoside-diphosphate reductase subunit M2